MLRVRNSGAGVDKVEFNDVARARLGEQIVGEINRFIEAFRAANEQTLFKGGGAVEAVLRTNVEQLKEAIDQAISEWAEKTPGEGVEKRVGPGTVAELAMDAMQKMVEAKTPEGRRMTKTRRIAKRDDVVADATAKAQELMKAHPDRFPDLISARAHVWKTNPTLADAHEALPPAAPAVEKQAPVQKGAATLRKIDAKADELRKLHPQLSEVEARTRAWALNPDLADEYERQVMA